MSILIVPYLFAQKTISGTVMDGSLNEALIGGTVQVKGKTGGIVTDVNGKYSIVATPKDVLVFTYIGYEKQEITVGNQSIINVTLNSNSTLLNEVVAIGYGTVKKSDLTGSIAVISTKELTKNPSASAAQALQGKAPGVLVSTNGAPGGGATIRVRGVGSISKSADPIYILDGIQVTDINGIQPQDIESFQVLKDASATAIYGANGSNGVIIITTKRGKSGKPQVNLNTYVGINLAPEKYKVMNANQYSAFYGDIYNKYGIAKKYTDAADNTEKINPYYGLSPEFRQSYYGDGWQNGTDWQSKLFKNGINQNYNLSVAGGGENSNFNISFGYSNEDGTIIKNSYERYHIRANSDFKLSKFVKIGENISANYGIGEDPITVQTTVWDLKASPLMRVDNSNILGGFETYKSNYWFDSNGLLTQLGTPGTDIYSNTMNNDKPNPLASASLGSNRNYNFNTSASIYLQIDITPWLMFKVTPSANIAYGRTKYWLPKFDGNRALGMAQLKETYSEAIDLNLENQLLFKKSFDKIHNVQATVVYQIRSRQTNNIGGVGNGFDFETLNTLSNASTIASLTGVTTDYRMLSYLGRVMYDYKGKYFATASFRSDGVSIFAPMYRRGNFGSGSLAWKINEDFLKSFKDIDALKLRLGYGQTGNSNIGDGFQYLDLITNALNFKPVFGDNQTISRGMYTFAQMGSREIHWESADMYNAGIDLNMFNGKLQSSIEYYIKNNNDLLVQVPISSIFGINPNGAKPWYNAGKIQNKGIELSLQWRDKIGDINYGIISNFTTINNMVVSLPVTDITSTYNRTIVGKPIGSLYGYVSDGIIQLNENSYNKDGGGNWQKEMNGTTWTGNYLGYKFASQEGNTPQPGDIKYRDLNGDGVITNLDKTIIGKTIPSFTYTIGLDCSYKSFDFNVFLFGVAGFDIYNQQRASLSSMNALDNMHNKLADYGLNHWTIDNTSTSFVRVDPSNRNANDQISSFWIEDGSFLRIKDVQVGYTLPEKITKKLGITSLRIYANASNVYCFTNYKGRDPEGFISSNPTNSGVDNGDFTIPKSYTCGLQIGF